jgi:hypothetical protein
VQDPIPRGDLVEPALDHSGLVEWPVATVVVGQNVVYRVLAADGTCFGIVGRRNNDEVVDQWEVFSDCGGKEIAVPDADGDYFDSHGEVSMGLDIGMEQRRRLTAEIEAELLGNGPGGTD